MTATPKKIRRRASKPNPPDATPATCIERWRSWLDDELEASGASPAHREKVESCKLIQDQRKLAEQADVLGAKEAARPNWEADVVLADKMAQDAHVLEGHRGKATKTDERTAFDAFQAELVQSQDDMADMPERLALIVPALVEDLQKLDGRVKIADRQRAEVEKAVVAMEEMFKRFSAAAELEADYKRLLDSIERFTVEEGRWEIVSVARIAYGPESGLRTFTRLARTEIELEQERLRVAGLHAEGELSEQEIVKRDRAERFEYRQALQTKGKAFRQTPEGAKAWKAYRQAAVAYNDAAGEALSPEFKQAARMLKSASTRWHTAICKYASLPIRKNLFPET